MKVFIDIGNSNIVIAVLDNNKYNKYRYLTIKNYSIDEYYNLIKDDMNIYDLDGGAISSVVPNLTKVFIELYQKYFNVCLLECSPSLKLNLINGIKEPLTLGADLLCDVVAAKELYQLPLIVCDLGTATKILVINKDGVYLGGAIMPGIAQSVANMFNNAALLKEFKIPKPDKVIGDDTESCIGSGVYYGTAAMLDGMIDKINEELDDKCTIILTGGLAESVKDFIKYDIILNDDLLLDGIKILYELNKGDKN